ncbi:MAG: quinone oxidoreductase [Candidatus Binatus sp.]|uniref:quinone oxidoreductase family protein n=1 Tax=Candidatus Binatus sp. TaxID=2811406 RepID=UPI0027225EA6|nr:quinone oxidoreductase [Candidatus Binatus sp.]MDO8431545.1 quinone oxidoreductase [Candidatus Binatus sp.]
MKAIVFDKIGGPEVMKIADVPRPEVKPGTVLLRVRAAGINFADTLFRQGQYLMQPQLPDTPGLECAGEIEAIGAGVTNLKAGQRVAALGSKMYAEYALAPAAQVIPIPDSTSFAEGAAFPIQVLTAWHMLHTSHRTGPGQTVLVHSAAGGVGIVAVQIAKAAGARVIGTVSSDSKFALVKEYGADDVINYSTHDFAAEANRLTGGRGVDLILDAVGATTLEKGLTCLAPFGHLILYGRAGGPPEPLNLFKLFEKSIKVSGFVLYTVTAVPEVMRRGIEESFKLMASGKLKLVVGKSFPLAEAAEAHRFMESRQSTGKLILTP